MRYTILSLTIYALLISTALANQINPQYAESIVNAIYRIEGSEKAIKPFGILSVHCEGYDDCRQICLNTVRNNYNRWLNSNKNVTYLEFLASRYAPIGADNDPSNLNSNWLNNLQRVLYESEASK